VKDKLLFPFRLVLGLVLYATSKNFRSLVQGKLRKGTNEPMATGEEVVFVLKRVDEGEN